MAAAAGGALLALAVSAAAPAAAAPRVPSDDTVVTSPSGADAHSSWNTSAQTPYGTYQNDNTRQSGARR
ncbi:MAG TPA: hypothetical protein VH496_22020 [Mycobacterium sp.]